MQDIYQRALHQGRKEAAQFIEPLRETEPYRPQAVRPPPPPRPPTAWGHLDNIPEVNDELWDPVESPWTLRPLTRPEAFNLADGFAGLLALELGRQVQVRVNLADGKERHGQVSATRAQVLTAHGDRLSQAEEGRVATLFKTVVSTSPSGPDNGEGGASVTSGVHGIELERATP